MRSRWTVAWIARRSTGRSGRPSAVFGPLAVGPAIRGDGDRDVTVELRGDRGTVDLRLALDPGPAPSSPSALVPRTVSAPRA